MSQISCLLLLQLLFTAAQFLPQSGGASVPIGCYVDGECADSTSLGVAASNTTQDCYAICANTASCNAFTQYNEDQLCLTFEECATFSADTCTECVSGDLEGCDPLQCHVEGKCSGNATTVHSDFFLDAARPQMTLT